MIGAIEKMKLDKVLDLMRRATANGTHKEVAAVIAAHWNPPVSIMADGKMVIDDAALRAATDGTATDGRKP